MRALALRRLTEAQLWTKLERKGFAHDAIREAVERCKRDGFVDDALFAALYVSGKRRAVGDMRLVGELVRRGIDREAALRAVSEADVDQHERIDRAIEECVRKRPDAAYPAIARTLERRGFPASLIYSALRRRLGTPPAAIEVDAASSSVA